MTTIMPAVMPNNVACSADGVEGSAVMATSPANAPFNSMVKSALPKMIRAIISAPIAPPAAAALVFKNTMATALALVISPSLSTEPPLNPSQPIHKISVPSAAKGKLAPGIARISPLGPYLPLRAPKSRTPDNAAAAPAICTIPEPAKSENPKSPRLNKPNTALPPHVQLPSNG